MKLPGSFLHPLFYEAKDRIELTSFHWNDCITTPFKYDLAYSLGMAPLHLPWENNNETVPLLFLGWKELEGELTQFHENRESIKVKVKMTQAIALLLQALFWLNRQPVRSLQEWQKEVNLLQYKPVNIEERLDFVMKRPELYHAFIQLQQLFSECTKLFYKVKIIEKQ
ncbi:YpoC family protein [Sutcliffiella halmapala]|uniref:YpoC family protein n=1 Tax=Sutcliffiella halmapala TaxID=79882 RepID=UPI0009954419|nr:hypothetical protein [Sutcliffiella halmapala]